MLNTFLPGSTGGDLTSLTRLALPQCFPAYGQRMVIRLHWHEATDEYLRVFVDVIEAEQVGGCLHSQRQG